MGGVLRRGPVRLRHREKSARMVEFKSPFGKPRPPTWAERARAEDLRKAGIEDVYVEIEKAPPEFWEVLAQGTSLLLLDFDSTTVGWPEWDRRIRWAQGWEESEYSPSFVYQEAVRRGMRRVTRGSGISLTAVERLSCVEHLLDFMGGSQEFVEAINERARWFRVGVRLEGNRFFPVTSDHIHESVVRPALQLLSNERFEEIDALYRKAFDRALSGDPSGAITAASSTVEEMLRLGLAEKGRDLDYLATKAVETGWIPSSVKQFVVKMAALRADSDAHTAGTDEYEIAMLALHIAGSILLYLGTNTPDEA